MEDGALREVVRKTRRKAAAALNAHRVRMAEDIDMMRFVLHLFLVQLEDERGAVAMRTGLCHHHSAVWTRLAGIGIPIAQQQHLDRYHELLDE